MTIHEADQKRNVRKNTAIAIARDDHPMLDAALRWADHGIPVFPCKRSSKTPLTPHGFKDASTDQATIKSWWSKWPKAMIGVPTGKASGIVVLDIDVKTDEFIDGFEHVPKWQELSPVIVRTPGGGAHLYFRNDDNIRCSTDHIAPGVDTRGEGGYVIAPPSISTAGRYDCDSKCGIDRLPAFPAELLAKLGPKSATQPSGDPEADPALIAAALQAIPNGNVGWDNWKKFGLATWRATGGSEEGFKAWDAWSQKSSKYDAENTRKEWDAITRSPPTRIGAGTIIFHANAIDPEWRREIKGIVVLPANAPLRCAEQFAMAHYLIEDENGDSAAGLRYYRGTFYEWVGGRYAECDEDHLRSRLYEFLDKAITTLGKPFNPKRDKVNQILDALKSLVNEDARREVPFWMGPREGTEIGNMIICRNGLLDLDTLDLKPHSPHLFNVNALPFDYDRDAPPPKLWNKFLSELWPDSERNVTVKTKVVINGKEVGKTKVVTVNDGKQARYTLQEIFGLMLTPETQYQKIFMLVGPGRSGKGTIGRVLTALIGKDNVAGPTLASFSTNFGLWALIDKRVAIIADARIGAKADTHAIAERLLSISGEDAQTIDRKYLKPWTGRLAVRFLILTNVLPRIADPSGVLASRFVLLMLTNSFRGKEDKKLTEKLCRELPGILNWSLVGLERLRKRGYFKMPRASREAIQQLEDLAAPVRGFLRDWCVVGPNEWFNVKGFYSVYRQWCELEGHKAGAQSVFGRDLKALLPQITTSGRGVDRKYVGVGLSEEGMEHYEHARHASPNRRSEA